MMGFAFILVPDTHNTDLITTVTTDITITVTRANIVGTGTIIGTITIEQRLRPGLRTYEINISVLALAFGALTFQSCEEYPNGASRGYYHGGYYGGGYGGEHYDGGYYDDGYYGGGGHGPTVVVSSGGREYHHRDGYNNGYYSGENIHHNGDAHGHRNVDPNGTSKSTETSRPVGTSNPNTNPNAHGNPERPWQSERQCQSERPRRPERPRQSEPPRQSERSSQSKHGRSPSVNPTERARTCERPELIFFFFFFFF